MNAPEEFHPMAEMSAGETLTLISLMGKETGIAVSHVTDEESAALCGSPNRGEQP